MKTILFSLPGNEVLTELLATKMKAEVGQATMRKFPDGESYTRILSEVKDKCVVLVCTLHEPDEKLLPLYFLSHTAKSLGATCTCLIAPYLAYMRQDKVFNEGEGITSGFFGKLISGFADSMTTVDPHLHRISALSEVYHIPNKVIRAADAISDWIKENVEYPVLIGPDSESEQWVSEVAKNANAPFTVLQKVRHGDRDVEVSVPDVEKYKNATPVLVDDIISTARTMIETVQHLKMAGMKPPICVGIHAVFSGNAYQDLLDSGVQKIVTCNTIPHPSNAIDLSDILAKEVKELMPHI
ncbi:MAG: phosphoribosylpyrophosphate synthetase [Sphingobacteriales bacterium 17-39-43]|uniref:ribose-phosphate pyrophosphokinase n=1 Tax=Daejeonella sp. TaxID=2805397 RepID=UPI000BD9FC83|nr:ribose-phosphate pyrophosphokinase [Daejeonella sp.]OYX91649.1 MAG: phosphoribosylpyrophosphate synthetase [Sphingobacteriia bacterium 35-40-5]OYZ31640.1 MAG: phosphoribosylpyrophosphate synthetase [Sphingobacteriales bacterium 16-39-50]OZA25035.1 MAG: phosphoribosylpyrophosphate synthetase [Sphingobacteriales bacterium 17-39-43]OZA61835.1 MAG: phosphoribosylpyrophosphate synthetase [Sphingobacteriales bacterium 39-40-5]HQS50567.1 ribose-phosphate pyrophosphokinase [Daejeonella sp.]